MPAAFALGEEVIANPAVASFAAFGSFAMLLLVDFGGPMRERLRAQAALVLAGGALVCIGTLASKNVWLATIVTLLVGFAVLFAGVVSSVLAAATTALLLALILSVSLPGPASAVPDRLAGWGIAGAAALLAVGLLWPAPTRDRLRAAAAGACRAVAGRLRSEVAYMMSDRGESFARDRDAAVTQAEEALGALHRTFLATPFRPTGLSTSARTVVRLVDELGWLGTIAAQAGPPAKGAPVNRPACSVKLAAAEVLERGAELLEQTGGDCAELHTAMVELRERLRAMEQDATGERYAGEVITSLDPSFRAQELGFAVTSIARNIDLTAAAERRSWLQRLLGRQPEGLGGTLSAAQARASAHFDPHSVWLHNSVRGAAGLGLAVFVANRTGVQHSFWVVLGTLSVLRSNALSTGQNAVRGVLGTVVGFLIGAALLTAIGTDTTLLWFLLPPAVLLAGFAPAAISFTAGQAAFTLTIVFLYNIIQPAGWRVGLTRLEDVALGAAVSLVVGLLFWPRGARSALRRALADAYTQSAAYLTSAVDFGMLRCDRNETSAETPLSEGARAAAASNRLDDTFRNYLAERGSKPLALPEMTPLLAGVGGLRLAGDAILDLWEAESGASGGDRTAARSELLKASRRVEGWYDELAESLVERREPSSPLPHDRAADSRLADAVRHDLSGQDGSASATAVRMIWTGDHLDAARRLQRLLAGPAREAAER